MRLLLPSFLPLGACAFYFLLFVVAGHAETSLNVTNFGAWGDLIILQGVSTVSNSSSITCPGANFVGADRHKLIEVFNGGSWCGKSNQTLIAYIDKVISPTTVIATRCAGVTATNLSGCYGTDDAVGFRRAISHAARPLARIIIPAGNYLMAPHDALDGYGTLDFHKWDVTLSRGGLTFEGQGNVTLTQSGWIFCQAGGPEAERGAIFGFLSPMNDNEPVVFTNITFYGGEEQGWMHNQSFPANPHTGIGWDMSHHAIAFLNGDRGDFVDSIQVQNCTFRGWRGEVLITTYVSPNTIMTVSNCVFTDNNATALNVDFAHLWINDLFSNMDQTEEFYRDYATMPSVMMGCLITNCGPIALNGGYYFDPPYTICGNQFYGSSGSVLYTCPACDVNFISNTIVGENGPWIGVAGYQDSTYNTCNSNILMAWNTFQGSAVSDNLSGFGIMGNGQDISEDIYFVSNQLKNIEFVGGGYGYSTNVFCLNNQGLNVFCFSENLLSGQWFLDESNSYRGMDVNNSQTLTNIFSYQFGRLGVIQGLGTGSVIELDDTHPLRVPAGATMVISNATSQTYALYPNASFSGKPFSLSGETTLFFHWSGSTWVITQ
jgi:hypothetical protein